MNALEVLPLMEAEARKPGRAGQLGRTCRRCRRWKQAIALRANPKLRIQLNSWCRLCQVARSKRWRAENAAAINESKRAHYAANRAAILARRREIYAQRASTSTTTGRILNREKERNDR